MHVCIKDVEGSRGLCVAIYFINMRKYWTNNSEILVSLCVILQWSDFARKIDMHTCMNFNVWTFSAANNRFILLSFWLTVVTICSRKYFCFCQPRCYCFLGPKWGRPKTYIYTPSVFRVLYVIQLSDRVYNVTLYTLSDSWITNILRI
jgi:hypothetical protein